jgi:diguanylate cyclase (GGDEF)-like protein
MTLQLLMNWSLAILDGFILAIALNFGSTKVSGIRLNRVLMVTCVLGLALILVRPDIKGQLIFASAMIFSARLFFQKTVFDASVSTVITYILFCLSHLINGMLYINIYHLDLFTQLLSYSMNYKVFMIRTTIFIIFFLVYRLILYTVKVNASSFYRGFNLLFLFNFILVIAFMWLVNGIYRFSRVNSQGLGLIKNLNEFFMFGVLTFCILIVLVFYFINHFILTHYRFKEVQFKAEVDEMTGAFNRATGIQMLQNRMRLYRNSDTDFTIAFVDVNNLKQVNDRYGHNEGDFMIQVIVKSIKDCLRESDFVFRYGGDEFVICFDDCYVEAVDVPWKRVANQLYKANAQYNKPYSISVSCGFSGYKPNKHFSVEELIELADTEMYKHKKNSKAKRGD